MKTFFFFRPRLTSSDYRPVLSIGLLLGYLACSFGCSSSRKQELNAEAKGPENDRVVLQIRKTPCYGTCPVYEALLYQSGRVLYKGEEHVPEEGDFEMRLSPQTIEHLLKEAQNLNFFALAAYYPAQGTDFPSTYLTLYEGNSYKTVRHQEGGPKRLRDFIQYTHEALEEAVREQVTGEK